MPHKKQISPQFSLTPHQHTVISQDRDQKQKVHSKHFLYAKLFILKIFIITLHSQNSLRVYVRTHSSVGQSSGLIIRRSWDHAPLGPLTKSGCVFHFRFFHFPFATQILNRESKTHPAERILCVNLTNILFSKLHVSNNCLIFVMSMDFMPIPQQPST